jgi:hypothetical protein
LARCRQLAVPGPTGAPSRSSYAEKRIDATGANPRLINDEQRGQAINDAFHGEGGLSDYFKQAKDAIYEQAKAESGSNPIRTSNVDALLKDPPTRLRRSTR